VRLITKKLCYMLCLYWLMVIQIIFESFPVSSSAHLMLAQIYLQKWGENFCDTGLGFSFDHPIFYFLHGPTILILLFFFAPRWSLFLRRFTLLSSCLVRLLFFVLCADLCTFFFFILFHMLCPVMLSFPLVLGLSITALSLLSLYFPPNGTRNKLDFCSALLIGCAQGLALLPGISRFGFTFVIARWLKFTPRAALEISFLVQWPLIVAGFIRAVLLDWPLIQANFLQTIPVLFMLSATVIAFYGLRFVVYMINTKRIWWFAIYLMLPIMLCFKIKEW